MNSASPTLGQAGAWNPERCRICREGPITRAGEVEFYVGYNWPIYDCAECGCRFTLHDDAAYELLYSEKSSCYSRYILQQDTCRTRFDAGDLAGLRDELSKVSKYAFVIDQIEGERKDARILEIGCSRGHLTSYFILDGRDVTGVDVSPTAVAAAREAFGAHFRVAGDPAIAAGAPYDAIFHVGTIGCLDDPIGTTKALLDMLKPGGRLLFNAPNREGLAWRGQLWVEGAPPPDLVTMFRPGFWGDQFSDRAEVTERIETASRDASLVIALRNLTGRRWRKPEPIPLEQGERNPAPEATPFDRVWALVERGVRRAARAFGLLRLAPSYPSEYGIFVEMKKR